MKTMEIKTKKNQYWQYRANGGTMSMYEWEMDGRYDLSLAGKTPEQDMLDQFVEYAQNIVEALTDKQNRPTDNVLSIWEEGVMTRAKRLLANHKSLSE